MVLVLDILADVGLGLKKKLAVRESYPYHSFVSWVCPSIDKNQQISFVVWVDPQINIVLS